MVLGLLKEVNENYNVWICNCTSLKILSIKQTMREVRQHDASHHSHKKRRDGNTGTTVEILAWTWNIWGWLYRAYIKTATSGDFYEELFSENDFETILATVVMIMVPRRLRQLRRSLPIKSVLQMFLLRYYSLNSQNIPINQ